MADDEAFLITPPPGLLPPPKPTPDAVAPVVTGSETRRTGVPPVPVPAATTPVPTRPTTRVPAPPVATALPAPVAVAPPADGAAPPPPVGWAVRLADGAAHPIGPVGVVLGRNPAPPAAWPHAVPIRIDDPGKSVSKTHAAIVPDGDRLRVHDLRSTNGVAVTPPGGGDATVVTEPEGLPAGAGAIVALGDYAVAITRG